MAGKEQFAEKVGTAAEGLEGRPDNRPSQQSEADKAQIARARMLRAMNDPTSDLHEDTRRDRVCE